MTREELDQHIENTRNEATKLWLIIPGTTVQHDYYMTNYRRLSNIVAELIKLRDSGLPFEKDAERLISSLTLTQE